MRLRRASLTTLSASAEPLRKGLWDSGGRRISISSLPPSSSVEACNAHAGVWSIGAPPTSCSAPGIRTLSLATSDGSPRSLLGISRRRKESRRQETVRSNYRRGRFRSDPFQERPFARESCEFRHPLRRSAPPHLSPFALSSSVSDHVRCFARTAELSDTTDSTLPDTWRM